jgi:anti-sigma factor RsiW
MTLRDEDLVAYMDGELDAGRAEAIRAALARDADAAARLAAFQQDFAALRAAYAPIADQPVPLAWRQQIEHATTRRADRTALSRRLIALAACALLAVGVSAFIATRQAATPSILAQAEAARTETLATNLRLAGPQLAAADATQALNHATGLSLHAPDLSHLGYTLVELDTYPDAAALRYRDQEGAPLTLYVRKSNGDARFDLLKSGKILTCIWQDDVVSAVMMANIPAGRMMRVASAAYVALL